MADLFSRYLDVGDLRLYVTRGGDPSRTAVVLSHGITNDGSSFLDVAAALAEDHHVVLVDARGHGRSDGPVAGYAAADHAGDLLGVIRALELDRPVLLGHSMGAVSTLLLAATHPSLPRAVVLEDPPPGWTRTGPPTLEQRARSADLQASLMARKRRTRDELWAVQREAGSHWSDAAIDRWVDATLRFSPAVIATLPETLEVNSRLDWQLLAPRISCPVLLVTGEPDRGAVVSREAAAGFRHLIPDAEVARLPGTGHHVRHERPAAYLDTVRGFLATLETHRAADR
jgi:pimeloyl-ACP methyl ester carboxylesterase